MYINEGKIANKLWDFGISLIYSQMARAKRNLKCPCPFKANNCLLVSFLLVVFSVCCFVSLLLLHRIDERK